MHAVIPKDYLPEEYQGTQGPLLDMWSNFIKPRFYIKFDRLFLEAWQKVIEVHHDVFVENYKKISNENLRTGKLPQNSQFGVDGSFKKMALD